ncbi:RNA-directed DNA polymerase [Vibrio vulnificus]|uniref:reverse transcriptase family protein n=1 Tax=Vibrio vulnificus TaxID=672 RepID=UPI001CDB623F|nr:reverse transcriptase family protein [Vibrio vulnificus]EIO4059264.1 RNA-directed DNA polymerase [Vibrio vulnificus]MCA3900311.1 RNA-directed DNA polymerase [Vibrio vulnificus]
MNSVRRDKPYYPSSPISSVSRLSDVLEVRENVLRDLIQNKSTHYHSFSIETTSSDGKKKNRSIHEPKFLLKKLQKRINSRILSKVEYPHYLQGGIYDEDNPRDYYSNAAIHSKANCVMSVDIKNFYPSIKTEQVTRIFKFFFKFPQDVSELLAELVTYEGFVPQGAVTSSYIANLLFFEDEYKVVAHLAGKKLLYSRLLDDITISGKSISNQDFGKIKTQIVGMFKKRGVRINRKKTALVYSGIRSVTGLRVEHSTPRCDRKEKRRIRAAVKHCEIQYQIDRTSDEYHSLWNSTSGKVAKLERVGHSQAKKLRTRLQQIYPTLSTGQVHALKIAIKKLEKVPSSKRMKIGYLKQVNKLIHRTSLVFRTDKPLAHSLTERLITIKPVKTYSDFWEK